MIEIPFWSIPWSLLTKGDNEYRNNVRQDNLQLKDIKKEIKKNYMSMKDCNNFWIKIEVVEKAVLQEKVRTKMLGWKKFFHKEDIADLL
jgi:hypothetical protein